MEDEEDEQYTIELLTDIKKYLLWLNISCAIIAGWVSGMVIGGWLL